MVIIHFNLFLEPEEIEDPVCYEIFDKNIAKSSYFKNIEHYQKSHYHNNLVNGLVIKHIEDEEDEGEDAAELAKREIEK